MTTIINSANMTPASLMQTVGAALKNHRQALQVLEDLYQWISAYAVADFEAAPVSMNAPDAQAIFNALTDAHNEYVNNRIGLPVSLPQTGYKYGDSQKAVIAGS